MAPELFVTLGFNKVKGLTLKVVFGSPVVSLINWYREILVNSSFQLNTFEKLEMFLKTKIFSIRFCSELLVYQRIQNYKF